MPKLPPAVLPKRPFAAHPRERAAIRVSPLLVESAGIADDAVYARLRTRPEGLTPEEASERLAEHGPNVLAKDQRPSLGRLLWRAVLNMVPGDVRIVQAKDLFVTQGSLTGESFPVEKFAVDTGPSATAPLERTNIAFLGTSVESGAATAVVVSTGKDTYLGGMAESLQQQPTPTAFDRGISRFTLLMLRFMAVMVPLVFVTTA